jgi:hypothetical protein
MVVVLYTFIESCLRLEFMQSKQRFNSSLSVVALSGILSSGCGASATNDPVKEPQGRSAYVAQPCTPLKVQSGQDVLDSVHLEVADVDVQIGAPPKEWLTMHAVPAHSVSWLSLPMKDVSPVSGPFSVCLDDLCAKREDGTLNVSVISFPTDSSAVVELKLEIDIPNFPPRIITVKTNNQEPVLAKLTTLPEQTLVITPYYLFEPKKHSLELLAQCVSRTTKLGRSE